MIFKRRETPGTLLDRTGEFPVHFSTRFEAKWAKLNRIFFNLINSILTVAPPPEWQVKIELNVHNYFVYPLLAPPYVPLAVLTRSSDL